MVTPSVEAGSATPPPRFGGLASLTAKAGLDRDPHAWLVPGEAAWEIWEPSAEGPAQLTKTLEQAESVPPPRIARVGLPVAVVTCQLFWFETTDEKALPDLIRMQCERRALLRQNEVWSHRVIRQEEERSLVQVLILQKTIPSLLEVEGDASVFEAHARCLALPPHALAVWRELGAVCLALTNETEVVHFQSLPHRELTRECLADIRAVLWLAAAQNWSAPARSLALVGDWNQTGTRELGEALGLPVERLDHARLAAPAFPMKLTPRSVRKQRLARRRRHRIRLAALAVAAVYAVFLGLQIFSSIRISVSKTSLESRLNAIMPKVLDMQTTARRMDALNPALDVKTYPLEILQRAVSVLPETGVRLTRFEITGNHIEIAGESATAREAFDYINSLETVDSLKHVTWDAAPQPVPLPNDTARFSIQGTIQGAYHEDNET